jgi:hypothetical protein
MQGCASERFLEERCLQRGALALTWASVSVGLAVYVTSK